MERAAHMNLEKSWVIYTPLLLVVVATFIAVRSDMAIFLFGESGMQVLDVSEKCIAISSKTALYIDKGIIFL
jgi:hypothetical protein